MRDAETWLNVVHELKKTQVFKDWDALLKARSTDIRSHALPCAIDWSTGLESSLALRSNIGQLSDGKRVEAAFASLGLPLDARMKAEAKRWHRARHTAVAKRANGASLLEQLAELRTMLVALLLRYVGYQGAVIGYEHDDRKFWRAADPAWWGDPLQAPDQPTAAMNFLVAQAD